MPSGKSPRRTRNNGEAPSIRVNADGELLIAWPNVTLLLIDGRNKTRGNPVKIDSREKLDVVVSRIAAELKEYPVVSIAEQWEAAHPPLPPPPPPAPPPLPKRTNWT